MTLIREDEHGLYVRVGGYVARPQITNNALAYVLLHRLTPTSFSAGDGTKAHHLAGSPLVKVGDELWFTHGESLFWDETAKASRNTNSAEQWRPATR
jgi:hypothetical protein